MAFTVGTVGIHGSNDFFLPQNGMGHQLPPLSNFNVSSPTSTNTTVTNTTVSPSTPATNSSAPTSNEAPSSPPTNQNATSPSRHSATPPQTNVYSYFNNVSSPNQYEGEWFENHNFYLKFEAKFNIYFQMKVRNSLATYWIQSMNSLHPIPLQSNQKLRQHHHNQ